MSPVNTNPPSCTPLSGPVRRTLLTFKAGSHIKDYERIKLKIG